MQIYIHVMAYIKLHYARCLMPLLFLCIHQILFYNHCSFQVSLHPQLKLVYKAWVCNYILQYSVGCTNLSCFHDWKWMVLLTLVIMLFLILTHWGSATHISVGKLSIIGSDNVLLPGQRQAIIWTNAEILLIHLLGTNFSVKFDQKPNIFIQENALENVICEMLSILSPPECVKHSQHTRHT